MSFIGPEGRKQLLLAAGFAASGVVLVTAIVVGYLGGRFIDGWIGTAPYGQYAGLILGIIAGFRNLFLLARNASKTASAHSADRTDDRENHSDLPPD
jgi:ATP synthase protein I